MNEVQQDPFAQLHRTYSRARVGRAVCGFLFLAPVVAWAIYYVLLVATAHGPDSGFAQAGTILYGLIAAPLLLLPLNGFIVFSIRCGSIARRLPFAEPTANSTHSATHRGTNSNATGNA